MNATPEPRLSAINLDQKAIKSHGTFIILVTLFVLLSILGRFQIPVAFAWWTSLRLALAGMFLLTASAHWGKRRPDLIRMVPPVFLGLIFSSL